MDFDLLTFESDIYGVNKAWQLIKEGKDVRDMFKEAVYFGRREEYKSLISYIRREAGTEHPLEIGGFDFASNSTVPYNFLITDIREFFQSINYSTALLEDNSPFAKQLRSSTPFGGFKTTDKWILDTSDVLINTAHINRKPIPATAPFFQFGTSYSDYLRQKQKSNRKK